jgi:hypothetical protein
MKDTWINLDSIMHSERRACLIFIRPYDFFGLGTFEDYKKLLENWGLASVRSSVLELLKRKYKNAENWTITHFIYSSERCCIMVHAEHPSFPIVELGNESPEIDDSHLI